MNLVIDSGNTSTKVAIFDQENLLEKRALSDPEEIENFLQQTKAEHLIVSSVNADAEHLMHLATHVGTKIKLTPALPLPIHNLYQTPNTLGADRIAGACGAIQLFPSKNTLVIDAGTCITYDFVDNNHNYHGGGISPGLAMRFKAVHTFTAKLPLVVPKADPDLIGNSTETSLQSGIVLGVIDEMDGIIARYRAKYPELQVILCGGDAPFFENQLKASIFACPNLVLIGLNRILLHNVVN